MMEKFLFINIIITALSLFIIIYAYSLIFFSKSGERELIKILSLGYH
jgi:hypothetical protein